MDDDSPEVSAPKAPWQDVDLDDADLAFLASLSPETRALFDANYDEEKHPRDEKGRWTDTGGSKHAVEWSQPVDANGRPIPIKVKTVEEAIPLVIDGKVVEMSDVRQVNTLIDKLAVMAREAEKAGTKAPNYDLCNVSVAGTNLFCADKLRSKDFPAGVPRIEMPQLAGEPVPGTAASRLPFSYGNEVNGGEKFIEFMGGLGYKTESQSVLAASLKASQAELVGQKVAGIMKAAATNRTIIDSPIFVSKDGYIVDGHHRWAAVVGLDTASGKFTTKMNIFRVDAPITEVLKLAHFWSERFGIKQAPGVNRKK